VKNVVEGLYRGTVVHARLAPVAHRLSYDVFAILFDCDRLDELDRRLRLFSRNRFNLFSLYDRDHGDGTKLADHLAGLSRQAGLEGIVVRYMMLCLPRMLGYAFNPITVFYGLDAADRIRLVACEVNNTFGERRTYLLPAEDTGECTIAAECAKRMHVSPFNGGKGRYGFRFTPPGDKLTVGVTLREDDSPKMRAHFRATRRPLTDAGLIAATLALGWVTVKVIAAIHYEALKLWLKGLPVRRRSAASGPAAALAPRPDRNGHA